MYNKRGWTFGLEAIWEFMILLLFCSIYAFQSGKVYVELLFIIVLALSLLTMKKQFSKYYLLWNVCFVGICVLSNLWTMDLESSLYATRGVIKIAIIGNLIIAFIENEEKIEYILRCFVVAGVALIFRLIIFVPLGDWGTERLGDDMYNSNAMGLNLSVSAICALYFLLTRRKRIWSYLILISTFIVVAFLTGSRKAVFFAVVGCAMLYIFNIKRKIKLIFILPAIVFLIYVLYSYAITIPEFYDLLGIRIELLLNLITDTDRIDASTSIRMDLIDTGIDLWQSKPWLGYGIQSFTLMSGSGMYAHNNYIELLVGIGLVGMTIYYSLYLFLIMKLGKLVSSGTTIAKPFFIIVVLLTINEIGLVSYGEETFQILLASGVACVQIMSRRKR